MKYFKNVYDQLKALEIKIHELNVENVIPVFVLGTLSIYSAGHFGAFLDKLETTGFGKQNLRSSYMHLVFIAVPLKSAFAIMSLAMKPVAVACRQ